MKPRSVRAQLFRADGQTDIHEADSRLSKFHERASVEDR